MVISSEEIQKLSVAERLALIDALWDSITAEPDALPLTEAQQRDIDRRLERYAADPTPLSPWDEVRTRLESQDRCTEPGSPIVAASPQHSDLDEQQLIEKYVDLNYDRFGGRADARLKHSGVSIWAIVGYLGVYDGDVAEVARIYDLSQEEVDAVLAYYRRNKKYVDARILLNEA